MSRSHQYFRPVPVVKLSGIMLRNRCWVTRFVLLQPKMFMDGAGSNWCDQPCYRREHEDWDLPLHIGDSQIVSLKCDMDAYMATLFGGEACKAQHFPLNLYPYPDHTHQQRPMPTHSMTWAHPCYSNCAHVFENYVMCITRLHQVLVGSDK
jgi:hypothetical protein